MSSTPEYRDDHVDREHDRQTQEIRYLAKYASYEFWLVVPRPSPALPEDDVSVVQLRFKHQPSQHRIMLSMREFEVFYEALGRLMEYAQQEHNLRQSPP